jgi:hypothetical protein
MALTQLELERATAWRERWGAQCWTREPGMDPKHGYDRVLLRFDRARVPLIEIDGQRCYAWLGWLAWRRDHEGLKP